MRRKNFPSALVLNPFSLFCRLGLLSMRTVKQESWPAFLSPWGSEAPACGRKACGSRDTNHGLLSVCRGCARVGPPETVARTASPPSHCFPARCGAAMERHERQIASEPVSAHLPPFTVGLTTGAVRRCSRCPSGVLRGTRRKPGAVVAGLPLFTPPPEFIKQA